MLAFDKICNLSTHLQSENPLDDVHVVCRFPWPTNLCYHFPFVVCMCNTPRPKHKPAFTGSSRTAQAACMSARAKRRHRCTLRKGIWAARSYTGFLVKLTPKGVAFSSFLFLRKRVFAGAIEDFTVAVEQAPFFADGWKRRGQARSALGHNTEALEVQPQHHFCGSQPSQCGRTTNAIRSLVHALLQGQGVCT